MHRCHNMHQEFQLEIPLLCQCLFTLCSVWSTLEIPTSGQIEDYSFFLSVNKICQIWWRTPIIVDFWVKRIFHHMTDLTCSFSPEKLYTDEFFFVNRKRVPAQRNTFAWSRTVFLKLYNNASMLQLENMNLQFREASWEWVDTRLSPMLFVRTQKHWRLGWQ